MMRSARFETVGRVALQKYVADGYIPGDPNSPNHPTYIFRRAHPGHVWTVATASLLGDPKWAEVHAGAFVAVPLVPYLALPAPDLLFGFGFQLAARATANLPFDVESIQLALASPAEDVEVDGERRFRIHAGIALRLK